MEKIQKLKDLIEKSNKIALFGHEYIDGDALGSVLAVREMFVGMGKDVSCFTTIQPSKSFSFLPLDLISTSFDYGDYDLIFFLDFSVYQRIGLFVDGHEDYFKNNMVVIIDHHEDQGDYGNLIFRDTTSSSNCEYLYEIFSTIDKKLISPDVATYLYMGLLTDTGNLSYEKNTKRTLGIASALFSLGAKKQRLLKKLFSNNSSQTINFAAKIMQRATRVGSVVYSYYDEKEAEEFGLDEGETALGFSLVQTIRDADIKVFFKKRGDTLKLSLRSQGIINCNELAKEFFNGGGHVNAAGGKVMIEKDYILQIKEIVDLIIANLDSYKNDV